MVVTVCGILQTPLCFSHSVRRSAVVHSLRTRWQVVACKADRVGGTAPDDIGRGVDPQGFQQDCLQELQVPATKTPGITSQPAKKNQKVQ
jgi:hypothetical protein